MNNKLIPKTSTPPAAQKVEQTGSTNVHVTNQGGGVVNINYNYQQPGGSNSAEQLMAIQSFSKEYYQLLVTCEEDVFINNCDCNCQPRSEPASCSAGNFGALFIPVRCRSCGIKNIPSPYLSGKY